MMPIMALIAPKHVAEQNAFNQWLSAIIWLAT